MTRFSDERSRGAAAVAAGGGAISAAKASSCIATETAAPSGKHTGIGGGGGGVHNSAGICRAFPASSSTSSPVHRAPAGAATATSVPTPPSTAPCVGVGCGAEDEETKGKHVHFQASTGREIGAPTLSPSATATDMTISPCSRRNSYISSAPQWNSDDAISAAAASSSPPCGLKRCLQPYTFGCTYTTGSSVPPVFSDNSQSLFSAAASMSPLNNTPSSDASSSVIPLTAAAASASAGEGGAGGGAAAAGATGFSVLDCSPPRHHCLSSRTCCQAPPRADSSSSHHSTRNNAEKTASAASPPCCCCCSSSCFSFSSSWAASCSFCSGECVAGSVGPASAAAAVLQESAPMPTGAMVASGIDFEKGVNLDVLLDSFLTSGFQATQLGRAILEVQRMQRWRLSDEPVTSAEMGTEWEDMEKRRQTRCCIWLSFTSNMISSGLREVIRFLCKHRFVDVLVASAGGIEEDFVKSLAPTIVGDFALPGKELRKVGWNRIGNLLVPNNNYCLFEDWLQPILDRMLMEQHERLRDVFTRIRLQHLKAAKLKKEEAEARRLRLQKLKYTQKAGKTPNDSPSNKCTQGEAQQQTQKQEPQQPQKLQQHQKNGLITKKSHLQGREYLEQNTKCENNDKREISINLGQNSVEENNVKNGDIQSRKGRTTMESEDDEEDAEEKEERDGKDEKEEEEKEEEKKKEEEIIEEDDVDYMEAVSDAVWSPSEVIRRLGQEINDENSVYYWCWKNNIPVFCPGLTDGSLGDNLFFHSYRKKGLVIDIVKDVRAVNDIALRCKKSGIIVLGGGLPKHHTCNANLMRNGADFAVYVNTGAEYDGSDSGARPDEAVSWGKITAEAKPVKVHGDATILFPLLVAATFARDFHANKKKERVPPDTQRQDSATEGGTRMFFCSTEERTGRGASSPSVTTVRGLESLCC